MMLVIVGALVVKMIIGPCHTDKVPTRQAPSTWWQLPWAKGSAPVAFDVASFWQLTSCTRWDATSGDPSAPTANRAAPS